MNILVITLSGFAEIFTFSTHALMGFSFANIERYATSSFKRRNVRTCMATFSAKISVTLKIVYNKKKIHFFGISPLMKYAFFTSLDEINGIFIPKI